ncbi:dTDP-4-dehydrorhamnose reductase [Desulfotomaculum arcticum]|uniref:dTDP-4-dehydrorhamnose reductase n=1 Tax=Desulfotruncus arcticus DSM 17038 TaxID=1121424 RepID=A0A1I2VKS7_9FIRM|nr:dTDP-4-dehydrorhamnose reductase [Desulfotruncus arcticus]SFG89888.1 dTDP-4-dehydrorhamnose reductase [Desulfotomaculum arcticum] [Desulfotruncus arcticus DSM 17038]
MTVLVTGAAGMLGQDVVAEFRSRQRQVIAKDHLNLDITNLEQVQQAIDHYQPAIVVNCAAYTDVDRAEAEPQKAYLINGLGPRNLALACQKNKAVLVQISTDYVFDGSQNRPYGVYDPANPLNVYGASKLWGENAVREILKSFYLIRTSWLFGLHGKNFVDTMLRLGQSKRDIKVVDDQFGCPTFTEDLARAAADLVATGCYGTYHITNQNYSTWFGLAESIFKKCNSSIKLVACKTKEMNRPAPRPGFSVLDPFPLKETTGCLLPGWDDALSRYLAKRGKLKL